MKRSISVRLTLMSAVTAGGLAACDGGVAVPGNFTDVATCIDAGNTSRACVAALDAAFADHEARAPRFTTREECLRALDVTECVEARLRNPDGSDGTFYVPRMAGFMLEQPATQTSAGRGAIPFYASRDRPGEYRDPDNLAQSRGTANAQPDAPTVTPARPPNVRTTTVSRSGFGISSGVHGSGGA